MQSAEILVAEVKMGQIRGDEAKAATYGPANLGH